MTNSMGVKWQGLPISLMLLATVALTVRTAHGASAKKALHVQNNGVDSVFCGTESAPCRSISQAISNATAGDEIFVGPGRYGDLDGDGILGETGEETGEIGSGCGCILNIDKAVTIQSTHGAAATVLDARNFFASGQSAAAVRISANGAVFGRPDHGFTLTGSAGNNGLVTAATRVTIAGNTSSGNAGGFSIFGSQNVLSRNVAVANNGHGFEMFGQSHTFRSNTAIGNNGEGFLVFGGQSHAIQDNVSTANGVGFHVFSGSANLKSNSAVGNADVGILIGEGATASIGGSNIFGNGLVPTQNQQTNCGLLNSSGNSITATNNFWGAATGGGADPADEVCDLSGSTAFLPFAQKPFTVEGAR
jgi:parallel beta-helix repeat protein